MGRRLERRRRWGPLGCLAALLGASILTSHFPPTQTASLMMVPITWKPATPFIGGNVTLRPKGKLDFFFCMWDRHSKEEGVWILLYFVHPSPAQYPGALYTDRETAGPGCSLHIRNLTQQDSGRYFVAMIGNNFEHEIGDVTIEISPHPPTTDKRVIAGIVVGALAGAVLCGVLLYYGFRYYRQRTAQRVSKSSLPPYAPEMEPTV